jgi:beta-N-acetylhexosaminidase
MKKPEIPYQDDAQIKENFNVAKQISAEIAEKSITVVRNRKGILPLDPHSTNKMLVAKIGAKTASINTDMDGVIALLKNRGIQVTVMEDFESWDCLTTMRNMELEGNRWDAFIVMTCLRSQDFPYSMRPEGASGKALWAIQSVETLQPVFISMITPFLINDVPYADTLVNCYSSGKQTRESLEKALFGEIEFNTHSPVKTGGWNE